MPAYRHGDYYDQDLANKMAASSLLFPCQQYQEFDDVGDAALCNVLQAMKHERPQALAGARAGRGLSCGLSCPKTWKPLTSSGAGRVSEFTCLIAPLGSAIRQIHSLRWMPWGFERLERWRGHDELATRGFCYSTACCEAGCLSLFQHWSGDRLFLRGLPVQFHWQENRLPRRYIYSSRDGSILGYCEGKE
jgi:hypothetical protein